MNLHPVSFTLMQTSFLLFLLSVIFAIQPFKVAKALGLGSVEDQGNETDYMALLAIKSQLHDHPDNGVLSSWNHSLHHCSWEGVTCWPKHNRVVVLNLPGRFLGGTISPFIGNLSFLRRIRLHNNSLTGQIPPEIGRLRKLQGLHLYNNSISGEIPPNISTCINLQNLSLGLNNLRGELPSGLGALSNLRYLWVYSNNLSGPLFKHVVNLTSLKLINCYDNAFTGSIPDNLSRMRKLVYLELTSNEFCGIIPSSISNLTSLQSLYLNYNRLQGSIPRDIGSHLFQLQHLLLANNSLSGSLPISLQNLTNLKELDLGGNNFTGSVLLHFGHLPNLQWLNLYDNNFLGNINFVIRSLINCTNLRYLDLAINKFTGVLPKDVANLSTNLVFLGVGENLISGGMVPNGISNLINLRFLDLAANKLTGSIPKQLGKLQRLEELYLYSNKLTGEIPTFFQNLSHLSTLSLYDNRLQGSLPPSLGNCASLLYMYMHDNSLEGPLPKELFEGSASFLSLNLSGNQLDGPLPVEIIKQFKLYEFDVSRNRMSGEIPPLFGNLFSLERLYMEDNFFHGPILPSLATLKSLTEIDLSQNNISGPIPEYFSAFPLIYLNLSYNNFEGKVPTNGVYSNASAVFLVGNNRLCGGIPELHLRRCMDKEGKKRAMLRALKLTISIICALCGVLAMGTSIWLYQQCQRRKRRSVSSRLIVKEPFLRVSYDMLLKATNNFSRDNLLGSGTFGSVYKGILDGNTIAVKVLNLQHRGGSKSFMAECKALRNVRHRNLVKILSACSSIDFQRNDFKALVYEFMSNGNLDRWLHEEGNLSLLQRVDIAIDVAHALDHLHHKCDNTILHRDLKPQNILLDNDFVAHVADFGLAKVLSQPLHSNQSSSIGVTGTIGYAAPEYGLGGEASVEADLYSYGILLLELMTKKRPTDNMFREDFNLHTYAKSALPDQVMQILDSKLTEDDHDHEDEDVDTMQPRTPERLRQREKSITILVEIGVACSDQLSHNRMKIRAAISELKHAKNIILNPRTRRNLARGARG